MAFQPRSLCNWDIQESKHTTAQVYRNNFWMALHGAGSPKRTTVWSTRRIIVEALAETSVMSCPRLLYPFRKDKGPLKKHVKDKKCKVKTTRHSPSSATFASS